MFLLNSVRCRYCQTDNIVKKGISSTRNQRFKCKTCAKCFAFKLESNTTDAPKLDDNYLHRTADPVKCVFCESTAFKKHGFYNHHDLRFQRYKCRECTRTWGEPTPFTPLNKARKGLRERLPIDADNIDGTIRERLTSA